MLIGEPVLALIKSASRLMIASDLAPAVLIAKLPCAMRASSASDPI